MQRRRYDIDWKVSAADDERFKKLETLAGVRAKPKPLAEKTIVAEKKKSVRKEVAKEVEDAPTEVGDCTIRKFSV
jgi:hypothetical protein